MRFFQKSLALNLVTASAKHTCGASKFLLNPSLISFRIFSDYARHFHFWTLRISPAHTLERSTQVHSDGRCATDGYTFLSSSKTTLKIS